MIKRVYIEAGSIAEERMSGVGHTAYSTVKALAQNPSFTRNHRIILLVAFNQADRLKKRFEGLPVVVRKIYIPGKIMNAMNRYNVMLPMDIIFGSGVYLFPNFKNWPLLFSKSITYVHDVYFMRHPEHIEKRNLSFLQKNLTLFIDRTDKLVTVSNASKEEIELFFPRSKGKITVVYNGINHHDFYPRSAKEIAEVRQKYNLPHDYFMFLSNLEPRKNIPVLLKAFKLFCDQTHKTVALILVGGMHWESRVLEETIKSMDNEGYRVVHPVAYVPDQDLPKLLSGAIALVHPALYEGFGISPLQSMACGTTVITGHNSSIPEVMGEAFKDYVDINDEKVICEAMMDAFSNPKHSEYGILQAKKFSWKKSGSKLADIISSLE